MSDIAMDVGNDVATYIDRWKRDGFPDYGERLHLAGSYAMEGKSSEGEIILTVTVPRTLIEMMDR